MKLKDLPIDMQKKYAGEVDVDGMQRIQYYMPDLAYALDIGEIADAHVDTENGVQILRMTVLPKKAAEYKTIRAAPKELTRSTVKKKQPKPPEKKKKGFLETLVGTNKGNRNNTDWIKKMSEGPKW